MSCSHHWKYVKTEPHGEDRILKHYSCTLCPKTCTRNVKKPRYTAFALRSKPIQQKQPNTSQRGLKRQRNGMRQVSDKRKGWLKQYEAKKELDGEFVTGWDLVNGFVTLIRGARKMFLEPHHPLGRVGCRVLFYRWATPNLHETAHKRAAWARQEGVILPEMSGRQSGPDQPDPFNILPEYQAYLKEHGLH